MLRVHGFNFGRHFWKDSQRNIWDGVLNKWYSLVPRGQYYFPSSVFTCFWQQSPPMVFKDNGREKAYEVCATAGQSHGINMELASISLLQVVNSTCNKYQRMAQIPIHFKYCFGGYIQWVSILMFVRGHWWCMSDCTFMNKTYCIWIWNARHLIYIF